ncbi:MAG TPA: hypothetical protein VFC63_28165 [Blastocatellia bacterium]|nr:hypothetical protein [Blastocatellia bacterium]
MLKPGIEVSIVCNDIHVLKIKVRASNYVFSGQTKVYGDLDTLNQFCEAINGFPKSGSDVRTFEIGEFDTEHSLGGVRFRFFCVDTLGHALVEVKLQSEWSSRFHSQEMATLYIPVEAAGIDSFVSDLRGLEKNEIQSAFLKSTS